MPVISRPKRATDARHTAEERRGEVLRAALSEFALHGLHGTSTEAIAGRMHDSQAPTDR